MGRVPLGQLQLVVRVLLLETRKGKLDVALVRVLSVNTTGNTGTAFGKKSQHTFINVIVDEDEPFLRYPDDLPNGLMRGKELTLEENHLRGRQCRPHDEINALLDSSKSFL